MMAKTGVNKAEAQLHTTSVISSPSQEHFTAHTTGANNSWNKSRAMIKMINIQT
jgi:hypothetical protein